MEGESWQGERALAWICSTMKLVAGGEISHSSTTYGLALTEEVRVLYNRKPEY
jgi:hypothetical protein